MNFRKQVSMVLLLLCAVSGYASADPTYMPGKYSDTPVKCDPKIKASPNTQMQMPGLEAGVLAARRQHGIEMSVVVAEMGDEIAKMKNVNEFPPKYTAALMKRWAKTAPAAWNENHLAVVLIALPPEHRNSAMAADPGSRLVAWGVDGAFLSKAIDRAYKKYIEVPAAKQDPQSALLSVLEQVNVQVAAAKQQAQAQAALLARQKAEAEEQARRRQARAEAERQAQLLARQKQAEAEARRAEAERLALVQKQQEAAQRAQREAAARPAAPVAPALPDNQPPPVAPVRSTSAQPHTSGGGSVWLWIFGFLAAGFAGLGVLLKSLAESAAAELKKRVTGFAQILQKLSSLDPQEGYGELVGENCDAANPYPEGSQEHQKFGATMAALNYLWSCFELLRDRETAAAGSLRALSWYNPLQSYRSYSLSTSDAIELPAPTVHVSQIKDMWNLERGGNSITPEQMYSKLQKNYEIINQNLHALQKAQADSAANLKKLDELVARLQSASDGLQGQGFKTNPFKGEVEKTPSWVQSVKALYAGNQPLEGAQKSQQLIAEISALLTRISTLVQARDEVRRKELPALQQKVEVFRNLLITETKGVARLAERFAASNFSAQSAQLVKNWSIAEQVLGTSGVKQVLALLDKQNIPASVMSVKVGSQPQPGALEVINSSCSREEWHEARAQIGSCFALLSGVMDATGSEARLQALQKLKAEVEGEITACGAKLKALQEKIAPLKPGEKRSNYYISTPETVRTELAELQLKIKEVSPPEPSQSLSGQLKRELLDAYVKGLDWSAAREICKQVSDLGARLDTQVNEAYVQYQQATIETSTLNSMINKARQLPGKNMTRYQVLAHARAEHIRLQELLNTRGQNWRQLEADAKKATESLAKFDEYQGKIDNARRQGDSPERIRQMEAAQASGDWGALETILTAAVVGAAAGVLAGSSQHHSGTRNRGRRQDEGDAFAGTPDAADGNSGNIGSSGGFRGPVEDSRDSNGSDDPFASTPDAAGDDSGNIGSSGGFRGPVEDATVSGDDGGGVGTDSTGGDDPFGDTGDSKE